MEKTSNREGWLALKGTFKEAQTFFFRHLRVWSRVMGVVVLPASVLYALWKMLGRGALLDAFLIPPDVRIVVGVFFVGIAVGVFFLLLLAVELSIQAADRKEPCVVGLIYRRAMLYWSGYVGIKIQTVFRVAGGVVLLVVPGILVGMKYCFAGMAYLYDGKKGKEAFLFSARLVQPHMRSFSLFLFAAVSIGFSYAYFIHIVFHFFSVVAISFQGQYFIPLLDILEQFSMGLAMIFILVQGYFAYQWLKAREAEKEEAVI